jgi:apolipoprotein N-acyltransferase
MYLLHRRDGLYGETIKDIYFGLTKKAQNETSSDIVVWPESAINEWVLKKPSLKKRIMDMAGRYDNTIILGAPYLDEKGDYYNAAFMITEPDNVIQKYQKIKVMPWVETYLSGKRPGVFELKEDRAGVLICFESMYPAMSRNLVKNGAGVIFVLSNDAGFNRTHFAKMHAREAVFRAAENRCPVVRAAQSGISMFIDRYGRVLSSTGLFETTILYGGIYLGEASGSPYTKYGDIFIYLCLAALLYAAVTRFVASRGDKDNSESAHNR